MDHADGHRPGRGVLWVPGSRSASRARALARWPRSRSEVPRAVILLHRLPPGSAYSAHTCARARGESDLARGAAQLLDRRHQEGDRLASAGPRPPEHVQPGQCRLQSLGLDLCHLCQLQPLLERAQRRRAQRLVCEPLRVGISRHLRQLPRPCGSIAPSAAARAECQAGMHAAPSWGGMIAPAMAGQRTDHSAAALPDRRSGRGCAQGGTPQTEPNCRHLPGHPAGLLG